MWIIALKMLFGDKAKYFGLVFGIMFATLLMSQQVSIFIGIMLRCSSQINDMKEVDIWVMSPQVTYIDEVRNLPPSALLRVKSVAGVKSAAPLYKSLNILRSQEGTLQQILLLGLDDTTLTGNPTKILQGQSSALREADSIIMDEQGYRFIWPNEKLQLGKSVEIGNKRFTIKAICDASPPFLTFPIVYTKLSSINKILAGNNNTSFVLVKAENGQNLQQLAAKISKQTGFKALATADFRKATIDHYLKRTGIPVNFGITILLGFIIGVAITGQTFYLFVIEKIKQFGALKAIGITNKQILKMVLLQAATAGIIGYGIGIGLASNFFHFTATVPALKGLTLYWQVAVGSFVAICIIVIIASIVSLRKVLNVDPAIVFRD